MPRVPSERVQGEWFLGPLPRVIAHRGLALEHTENTIGAFRAALEAGATHLETDAHATRDGIAVLMHDADLSRITGDGRAIASVTLAELRGIAGDAADICTLIEALQTFPSALFNLDVKAPSATEPVVRAIREADAQQRVLITSFRTARRRAVLRELGSAPTSASSEELLLAILGIRLRLPFLTTLALRRVMAVQIPRSVLGFEVTSAHAIAAFHRAGVEVHVWTINEPAAIEELLRRGADGIVSDRCDVVAAVVSRLR